MSLLLLSNVLLFFSWLNNMNIKGKNGSKYAEDAFGAFIF